ncbi:hypothetical protein D3H65_24565 [Paraflavitalea soli]|uniref:PEGA domain-containing protein n=1 Tax=Paraflavitalea soli TaxID=2315862 RepID=A0A3B7MYZ2_9BACT|nr:hypothetical protein [Paraflavitalea soli]AXY76965.1 hypothetical protein D3H65_24565 [Paraflavitalea soli]
MKKIFTLAAILLSLSVATFAADRPKKGKISVTSNTFGNLIVKIDGQRYNMDRNDLVLNSIRPGNHRVEIYRMERRGIFGGMRTKVLYSDNVFVAPDQLVNLNVNRNDYVVVRKSGFDPYGRDDKWGRGNDRYHDYSQRDDDRDHRGKW